MLNSLSFNASEIEKVVSTAYMYGGKLNHSVGIWIEAGANINIGGPKEDVITFAKSILAIAEEWPE